MLYLVETNLHFLVMLNLVYCFLGLLAKAVTVLLAQ